MKNLIVVDSTQDWRFDIPDVEVVSAKNYIMGESFRKFRNARIFNFCKSYKYQSIGYYVSLLAAARGHKPIPSVSTIQDMKSQTIIKLASEELDELMQKSLHDLRSKTFVLSIYFGKNVSEKYHKLAAELYGLFNAPFVRAHFHKSDRWYLKKIGPISATEIPPSHHEAVMVFCGEYFAGKRIKVKKRGESRFSLAILVNPKEENPPSNTKALGKFSRAAENLGMEVEFIERDDYSRLAEFDGLFIRETTNVNHHTYRFARRAQAEGLVVIDDPDSILKCTNKVYLNEVLQKNGFLVPKTMIVTADNVEEILGAVGLPCVLKSPDSSFSQGVVKVDNADDLMHEAKYLLGKSALIIAQEFLPTDFDWRVGVLDGKAIYVSKYHMVKQHWQIIKRDDEGNLLDGDSETLAVESAPPKLITLAEKAAALIGKGLYGLDLKEVRDKYYVIEINDNPSIDAGCEDAFLKDELYQKVMETFLQRMILKKEKKGG